MITNKRGKGRLTEGSDRRERVMILRCIIKQRNEKLFIGECLELGIVTQAKSDTECKHNLMEALEAYIEAGKAATSTYVTIRPVAYYPLKRIIFDLHWYIKTRPKHWRDSFKTERSVPVGI